MQLTSKQFRQLAQGTQSIVVSVAVIAALAMAWQVYKSYREGQQSTAAAALED